MAINAISLYQKSSSYAKNTTNNEVRIEESVFAVREPATTTQQPSTVNDEFARKFDVRNATFEEIVEISNALYESGAITLIEHATLTFDFGRATDSLKQKAKGKVSSDFSMYKTAANNEGKRDWLAEFSARAADHYKFGNLIGYQMNSKVLAILEKLTS